ncbi:hypothetical protein ACFQ61_10225 [Streptomyces sp. NPDC056500]|uniref:hypothetical protein n=1 Tax=unclassified Streptomyces TaxID=2593676 RepID=UPI00340B31C8
MAGLSEHDVARCTVCGARIRWTVTARGKQLAVDADPDDAGNTAVHTDHTGRTRSRGLTRERPVVEHAEWLARPHIAAHPTKPPVPPRSPQPWGLPDAWRAR